MNGPYASLRRRWLALQIDGLPVMGIFIFMFHSFGTTETRLIRTGQSASWSYHVGMNSTGLLMSLLFWAFYSIGMEFTFGGTIGKLLLGMRVRNTNGTDLSIRGAICRFLFFWADGLFLGLIGAIIIKLTAKHQRIGDIIGDTVVVYKEAVFISAATIESASMYRQSYS